MAVFTLMCRDLLPLEEVKAPNYEVFAHLQAKSWEGFAFSQKCLLVALEMPSYICSVTSTEIFT